MSELKDIVKRIVSDDHNPTQEIKWVLTTWLEPKREAAHQNRDGEKWKVYIRLLEEVNQL